MGRRMNGTMARMSTRVVPATGVPATAVASSVPTSVTTRMTAARMSAAVPAVAVRVDRMLVSGHAAMAHGAVRVHVNAVAARVPATMPVRNVGIAVMGGMPAAVMTATVMLGEGERRHGAESRHRDNKPCEFFHTIFLLLY